jgi:Domain of unknown function (DUF4942)
MDFQFYPTPRKLAERMWAMFKNRDFVRVLEPSAGDGALVKAGESAIGRYRHREFKIDCCEIDVSKHPLITQAGGRVIELDFMRLTSGNIYSHIILNPPFAHGVAHVLHAWDLLWDGEIVAIINAESLRNPFSQERKRLAQLVFKHGEVEYIDNAFMVPDADRKTPVSIALIRLEKKADGQSILGDYFESMREDHATADTLTRDFETQYQVAMPNSVIENQVLTFRAAVRSMQESVLASARAAYYEGLLGKSMNKLDGEQSDDAAARSGVEHVRSETAKHYDDLKDRAWANILRSSQFTDKLSAKAQRDVESEFETIKKMEFTVSNVYSFLIGLSENQGKIQDDMLLDCFDEITKYYIDNTNFYRGFGWVSNTKHRTCGMRIRGTRFILPYFKKGFNGSLEYGALRRLDDFDRVFAMLDGKHAPEVSLRSVFENHSRDLLYGERLASSYFEVRWYGGIGTVHFFPRSKELMDRFNRRVGALRRWLPPETDPQYQAKDFWSQYEKPEKFQKELVKALSTGRERWNNPLEKISRNLPAEEQAAAMAEIDAALAEVQLRHGIDIDHQLTYEGAKNPPKQELLLLAA